MDYIVPIKDVAFFQKTLLATPAEPTNVFAKLAQALLFCKSRKSIKQLLDSIKSVAHSRPLFAKRYVLFLKHVLPEVVFFYERSEIVNYFINEKLFLLFLLENSVINIEEIKKQLYLLNSDQSQNSCESKIKYLIDFFSKNGFFSEKKLNKNAENNYDIQQDSKVTGEKEFYSNIDNECMTNRSFNENQSIEYFHENLLFRSIQENDTASFQSMLNTSEKIDLNEKVQFSLMGPNAEINNSYDPPTLICYSAFFGAIDIFKYLFLQNAKINEKIAQYAVAGGNYEIIHILEEKKIPFLEDALNTAIEYHRNEIAEYINSTYEIQYNLRHFFTSIQFYNINSLLEIIKSVNINSKMRLNGKTALHIAIEYDRFDIVVFLSKLPEIDLEAANIYYITPLEYAVILGKKEIVEYLINHSKLGLSFHYSIEYNQIEIAKFLIRSVLILDINNRSEKNGKAPIHEATELHNIELLKMIISVPYCDINNKTDRNETAFFLAASKGYLDILEFLNTIEGIDQNSKDINGVFKYIYHLSKNN